MREAVRALSTPGERYIIRSPGVFVPAKILVWLTKRVRLDEVRLAERGKDSEIDQVLFDISEVEHRWRAIAEASAQRTTPAPTVEPRALSNMKTTTQAATLLGITRRRVNDLIADGTLTATKINGTWLISAEDVNAYRKSRG